MQDIEFTVQQNKLYMLQTAPANAPPPPRSDRRRNGEEGLIDEETAIMRVNPASLDQLLHPTLDPKATRKTLCQGPARKPRRRLRRGGVLRR